MIYLPCHDFIMIYTPAPKRAYRRRHTARRQASLHRGRNVAFSLSTESNFSSVMNLSSWLQQKAFGLLVPRLQI